MRDIACRRLEFYRAILTTQNLKMHSIAIVIDTECLLDRSSNILCERDFASNFALNYISL